MQNFNEYILTLAHVVDAHNPRVTYRYDGNGNQVARYEWSDKNMVYLMCMDIFYPDERHMYVSYDMRGNVRSCSVYDADGEEIYLSDNGDYSGFLVIQGSTEQCPICLTEGESRLCHVTGCNHTFCVDCLRNWISTHNTCPICRASLI